MEMIKIDDIELDEFYIRERVDLKLVDEYAGLMRDGVEFRPILVFREGHHCRLCDGRHRLEAKRKNGAAEIEAEIRSGDRQAALTASLKENREHGARLTAGDKRRAIGLAVREFPDMSQHNIATLVGCSQSWVAEVKNDSEVIATDNLPTTVVGRDGKHYPGRRTRRTGQTVAKPKQPTGRSTLARLQRDWKVATPADRAAFIDWIHAEDQIANYALEVAARPDHQAAEDPEALDDGPLRDHDEQDEAGG